MSDTAYKISVMQAFERAEAIECRIAFSTNNLWIPCSDPAWDWPCYDYRIAPKPLECWVYFHNDGTILHLTPDQTKSKGAAESYWTSGRAVLMREVLP